MYVLYLLYHSPPIFYLQFNSRSEKVQSRVETTFKIQQQTEGHSLTLTLIALPIEVSEVVAMIQQPNLVDRKMRDHVKWDTAKRDWR